MEQQHDESLYDDTGTRETSKYKFVNFELTGDGLDKTCQMRVGAKDGPRTKSFAGVLVDVQPPEWRAAFGRSPASYEYKVILRAKDKADGQIRDFSLTFRSHWASPINSDAFNQIAGALLHLPGWNRKIRINAYAKVNKTRTDCVMRCCLYDGNGDNGPKLPYKFPWVGTKEDGYFQGVPQPVIVVGMKPDYSVTSSFWHQEYLLLCKMFGHDVSQATPAAGVPVTGTAPAPAGAAPTASGRSLVGPPIGEQRPAHRTLRWIVGSYATKTDKGLGTFCALVQEGFTKMATLQPPPAGPEMDLARHIAETYAKESFPQWPHNQGFDAQGSVITYAPTPPPMPVADMTNISGDDLPF